MRIQTRISCRPRQVSVLFVRNVLLSATVPVFLSKPIVYEVHNVRVDAQPHQVVVGFDVPVDDVLSVDLLNALYHLVS